MYWRKNVLEKELTRESKEKMVRARMDWRLNSESLNYSKVRHGCNATLELINLESEINSGNLPMVHLDTRKVNRSLQLIILSFIAQFIHPLVPPHPWIYQLILSFLHFPHGIYNCTVNTYYVQSTDRPGKYIIY